MTVQIPMQDVFDAYRVLVTTPLGEVAVERAKQDEKWGEQNHPMVCAPGDRTQFAAGAWQWQRENAARAGEGRLSWDGVLLEEVYEAMAEEDPARQREELVQVAAVAVAMIECLDRASAQVS